jgi:hypothetical protein
MRRLYYHHHLSYFTESSLTSLARSSGLEIAAIETRNQEMSRLNLSPIEKLGTRIVFGVAERYRSLGGKLLLWARKV